MLQDVPLKWMAPESVETGIYSIKSDVVSPLFSIFLECCVTIFHVSIFYQYYFLVGTPIQTFLKFILLSIFHPQKLLLTTLLESIL